MNRRLRRKVHERFIEHVVVLMQEPAFNTALANAPVGSEWELSAATLLRLPSRWTALLRRWKLRFTMTRVPPPRESHPEDRSTLVFFRIAAVEFPQVRATSYNDPSCSSFATGPLDIAFVPGSPHQK